MKFLRFAKDGKTGFGVIKENRILEVEGDIFVEYKITQIEHRINEIRFLPPCSPTKIVAVGLNYRDHALEMKKALPEEPLLFIKPATAVIASGDRIICPPMSKQVEFEGELAIVIGRTCRRATPGEANAAVLGYTCMIDVTARDIQRRENHYTRAKGFDTFAPLG